MIDKADCVIAVWDGNSKGTEFSIDYARKKEKPVYVKVWKAEI